VNLAKICSAVPEIFDSQTNKKVTDSAKNRTLCSSLRVVKKPVPFTCKGSLLEQTEKENQGGTG